MKHGIWTTIIGRELTGRNLGFSFVGPTPKVGLCIMFLAIVPHVYVGNYKVLGTSMTNVDNKA